MIKSLQSVHIHFGIMTLCQKKPNCTDKNLSKTILLGGHEETYSNITVIKSQFENFEVYYDISENNFSTSLSSHLDLHGLIKN